MQDRIATDKIALVAAAKTKMKQTSLPPKKVNKFNMKNLQKT